MTVIKFVADAQGALDADNGPGHVKPRERLDVRTGVCRDNQGGWTTEEDLATAFGMTEILWPTPVHYTVAFVPQTLINLPGPRPAVGQPSSFSPKALAVAPAIRRRAAPSGRFQGSSRLEWR